MRNAQITAPQERLRRSSGSSPRGTKRRDAIQALIEKSGGKLIGFYFAYGEADAYVITEYPDRASALALSIAVNASGAVRLTQIELMLPEEVDAAITKLPAYRAPGT